MDELSNENQIHLFLFNVATIIDSKHDGSKVKTNNAENIEE